MTKKLSEFQEKVLAAFDVADMDIAIMLLYTRVYGDSAKDKLSSRDMQMKLAPMFKSVNEKLVGKVIEPGKHKRTYRLTTGK